MGFYVQDDYWEALKDQPPKVRYEVLGALCDLYFTGEEPELNGLSKSFFVALRGRVQKARQKARQKQSERTTNDATDAPTDDDTCFLESERESKSKREKKKTHRARFTAPTESEFCDYAISKGATPDKAKQLFHYYDSQGWLKANGLKLVNWKSAVSGAIARDNAKAEQKGANLYAKYDD